MTDYSVVSGLAIMALGAYGMGWGVVGLWRWWRAWHRH